jgi:UDP-galactopyranose mutase
MAVGANIITRRAGWLVVGMGFTGATAARRLAETTGEKIIVIDRRPHLGGNAYDCVKSGIRVHRYGPHIFHTNSKQVWDFLSRFTSWRPYEHRVEAVIEGVNVPLPFNFLSTRRCFESRQAERIIALLSTDFGVGARIPILRLLRSEREELRSFASFVYDNVFLNYSKKLWGLTPEELMPSVTARVPVVASEDDRYFQDRYQAMPVDGYENLFASMLDHPNIDVVTDTDLADIPASERPAKVIYTGPIDEYFGWRHGVLEYRSVRFAFETLSVPSFQEVGTVNYPNMPDLLRITEFKHLTGDVSADTVIVREYPQDHLPGETDAFYPLLRRNADAILPAYQAEALQLRGSTWFAGRLADYQYYNMDQACARGLALVDKEILNRQASDSRLRQT